MRPESAKLNHSWNIFWCSLGQGPIGPDPISMRNLTVESQRSGDDWNFENLKDENRREKRILEEWDSSVLALFYNSFGALNERYIAKGICATSKVFLGCQTFNTTSLLLIGLLRWRCHFKLTVIEQGSSGVVSNLKWIDLDVIFIGFCFVIIVFLTLLIGVRLGKWNGEALTW